MCKIDELHSQPSKLTLVDDSYAWKDELSVNGVCMEEGGRVE